VQIRIEHKARRHAQKLLDADQAKALQAYQLLGEIYR
tara:strand:+ start:346 stop:456 length:111 start_codon:yes stop_codon:yes gene_type:complete